MIVTRKIEIYVNEPDLEKKKEHYDTLHKWRFICLKAANLLSSHFFTQDNIKQMLYLEEGIKIKLADKAKDEEGILCTSYQNSGYKLLSGIFKGQIPMDIISNLNNNIQKTYKEEKTEYYKGERSLRSYRSSIPMPFSSSNITFSQQEKSKNFDFSIYKIPFSTCLGADKSGNEIIINRIVAGEYKFCNSSFQWNKKKNKWFLLLCVDIPKIKLLAKEGVVVEADLNMFVPIIATCNGKGKEIGNSDEFGYNRIAIQNKLNSLQKDLKYTSGGKGRNKKLQAVERFKEKEKNYVKTKLHIYSRMLVNFAIDMKAESIRLVNHELKVEDSKENAPLLLRNWSYYGLQQMIEYKAKQVGINLLTN